VAKRDPVGDVTEVVRVEASILPEKERILAFFLPLETFKLFDFFILSDARITYTGNGMAR
jgi:hypothetical protein